MPIVAAALQGTVACIVAVELAVKVMRNRKPSPAVLADWIGASAGVIVWVAALLVSIGSTQGWMHGAFEYSIIGICALFLVGVPVYKWRGRQRLVLALTARAAAGRWPWSAG